MKTPRSPLWRILSLVLVLALFAVACGDSGDVEDVVDDVEEAVSNEDDATDDEPAPTVEAMDEEAMSSVSGEIFISGSSTVEPISVRVAELFEDVAPDVSVDVEGPGTGDGFAKFCNGETDVSDASRAIKDSEAEDCAANGIEFTEILVGIDGIGVMTNENNSAVECVTFENLYGLIGPESDDVTSWADANAIAGEGMPDAPLDIFGPGEESGTYDSFIEIVLEDIADERGQEATTRSTYSPSADDNVILSGITSSDTSLGWVGFAFANEAAGAKLLEVDGGNGCVAATPETIASNEYPISRNLYIYVNNGKAEESEALRAFIDFYTSTGLTDAVASVGYVELTADARAATAEAWATRGASLMTDDAMAEEESGGDESAAADVEGEIFISGSSTVEPVSVRVAELFEDVAPGVFVDVEGPGTGDGFAKFCNGETDISDASRAIKDSEAEDCAANGIEFTEILVGIDGIGVMTSENNSAVECVTFENLYGLIGPESDDVTSWADANAIAGEGLPDAPLDIFGPGEESGTYDSFIEIVLEDIADERGQDATTRSTYSPSADDNVILSGIQSSDTSLGWVGFAFAANAEGVKLLEVDGGDGCVAATPDTIASNEYPISRNLYIYVNNGKAEESPALQAFVDFYVTTGLDEAVSAVGYVPLTDDAKASTQTAWETRDPGSAAASGSAAPTVEIDPNVEGEIFISGSSTVEPVSVRVAELFEDVAPGVFVDVEGPGTGDGFAKFCNGETDISDASRAIKDSEAEDCAANGIEFTEILVGIDGIGVMTSENNSAVECVTFENLYGLIGPESDDVTSWADANAIAGEGLPDAPLDIFGPGEESGTYDSFIEIVLEDIADERGQDATTRSTYSPSADDNVILSGIQSSDTSLGWVGFAFAANAEGVKLLEVDGGDGCVAATPDTIASNEYPISRNLYIYVNNGKAEESPALQAFVDFYVTTGLDEAVGAVGYVPLTDDAKAEVANGWLG